MKNPLRESGVGKGDKPRVGNIKKYKQNFDLIKWIPTIKKDKKK